MDPARDLKSVKALLLTDLHCETPHQKAETLIGYTENCFFVYLDGSLTMELPLDELKELALQKGVGCVSVEYTLKSSMIIVVM